MTRYVARVLFVSALAGCAGADAPAPDTRVPILNSVSHQLASRAVGASYQVSVVLPRSYGTDTTRRFPVVVVLDGNQLVGVAASVAYDLLWLPGMPELIIVGVDYPVPNLDQSAGIRFRDLTPSVDSVAIAEMAPEYRKFGVPAPTRSGGGPAFLKFLTDELSPFIDSVYRTTPADRTLLGLSLGGLFTLYALHERPEHFRNYIALSPSLWWHNDELLKQMSGPFAPMPDGRRLFVSIGLLEEDPTYRMVSNVRKFENALRTSAPKTLQWHVQYFPEENHNSGWPAAMSRGIRYTFGLWSPAPSGK